MFSKISFKNIHMKNLQINDVREILKDTDLSSFIRENLRSSLSSIGFSREFLDDLLSDLGNISIKNFGEKWESELQQKYSIGFFQNLVPKYFSDYVVPATPSAHKIVDVGCGTGILAKLYSESRRFKEVIGIDINQYSEWEIFSQENTRFKIVKESEFADFLLREKPDCISVTWTLHHMNFDEQKRYIGYIYQVLKTGSKIIVLEDSYSTNLTPGSGLGLYNEFMSNSPDNRKKIMAVYDWVANRVLAQRSKVPMSFGYRTLEEWQDIFEEAGFRNGVVKFIGFPTYRDINTPQSLMIFEK